MPPLYLHCAFTLSLLYFYFIFIVLLLYLHCAFVHSSPVRMTRTVLPPPQSPFSVTTLPLWRGLGGGFSRFPVTTFPLIEEARYSGVCVRREVCLLFQLVPLRGFGGLPNKRLATFPLIEVASDSWVCVKGEVIP